MASENNLGGSVGLDTTAFKKGVMELTNQMKAIENSFRASAAVMGDWSSSTQGLSSRVSSLQDKLTLQRKALDTLNSAYQKAVSEQGADSKSAQSLAKQMFDMQGKIKGTEGQLKKYQAALKTAQKEEKESTSTSAKLGKAFQDFAKQSKSTSDTVKSHFSGLKSIFSGLGGAIAGFAVSLGAGFSLKGIIDSADAAEKTAAQMNAVLSSTKGIAGMTASQLNDLAASQAKVTTFSAGTTKQAENMLLTFTNIHSNVFPQTIKATEDMATAMHTDATSAAQQLGKALNDPATGYTKLQRVGVTFSASQIQTIKTMEKAGNTAGAQKIILQELEKEFGGSAEAAGSTFSGQLQIAQNTLKSVGATIGTALLPAIKQILPQLVKWGQNLADTIMSHKADIQNAITNVSDGIQKLFAFISSNGGTIKGIIAGIATTFALWKIADLVGTAIGAIKNMKTALEGAKTAQEAFNIAMGGNPIGLIVIAIGALVAAFAVLWNNCEGFRNFWIGLWDGIKSIAQTVGAWFSGPFKQFFQSAGNGIKSFFTGIPGFFINIWNGIKTAAMAGWNAIKGAVMAIVIPFIQAIQGPFETLKTGISNILNGLKSIFSGVWTIIKNIVLGPVLLICDLVTGNFTKLKSDLSHVLTNIKNGFSSIWNGIKQYLTGIWQVISGAFGIWLKGLLSIGSTIGNSLKSFFTGLWAAIKIVAINSWDNIVNFFRNLPSKFLSAVKGIGNAIKNGFTDAINFIKSLPGKMLEWGKDMINGLINGIKSMIGNVGKAINGVADKIRSILHFSVPDEGPLTDYESWMPDFMSGLARGIESNKFKVVNAMRSLAADMAISPAITPAYVGGYSAPATVPASAATYVFYQYNNSPKALSPAETARQTRNLLRQASLQSRRR